MGKGSWLPSSVLAQPPTCSGPARFCPMWTWSRLLGLAKLDLHIDKEQSNDGLMNLECLFTGKSVQFYNSNEEVSVALSFKHSRLWILPNYLPPVSYMKSKFCQET